MKPKVSNDIQIALVGIFLFINLYLWGLGFALALGAGMGAFYFIGKRADRFIGKGYGNGGVRVRARRL